MKRKRFYPLALAYSSDQGKYKAAFDMQPVQRIVRKYTIVQLHKVYLTEAEAARLSVTQVFEEVTIIKITK